MSKATQALLKDGAQRFQSACVRCHSASSLSGVRAEPYAVGSDELTVMELDLMQRAAGMTIETPAVRP